MASFFPPYLSILIHSRIHSVQSDQRVRIVNGEGDFLPGLIVDRYSEFLVCQFFTARWIALNPSSSSRSQIFLLKGIFEKSEGEFGRRRRHRTVSRCVGRRAA